MARLLREMPTKATSDPHSTTRRAENFSAKITAVGAFKRGGGGGRRLIEKIANVRAIK